MALNINPLNLFFVMNEKYSKNQWINALISALIAFLTALGAASCAQAIV